MRVLEHLEPGRLGPGRQQRRRSGPPGEGSRGAGPSHHHAVEPPGPWRSPRASARRPRTWRACSPRSRRWARCHGLDAVLTGYFATAGQVEEVARLLGRIARSLPAGRSGDGRSRPASTCRRTWPRPSATHLVPRATCLTPNGFELAWLSGMAVTDEASAIAAARALGAAGSARHLDSRRRRRLATLLVTPDEVHRVTAPKLDERAARHGRFPQRPLSRRAPRAARRSRPSPPP